MNSNKKCFFWLMRAGVVALFAATLLLPGNASILARTATKTLPVLRLHFFDGSPNLQPTLDPILPSTFQSAVPLLVNANLVHVLPGGRVVADLATWKRSKNGRVYTFTLRATDRFSNGHYVTAQDAEFSIKRALAPTGNPVLAIAYAGLIQGAAAFSSGVTKDLAGVKVVRKRVLQITLTKPAEHFLAELSLFAAEVLDPAEVAGKPVGTPPDFKDNYLSNTCMGNQGAGPFKLVCRKGGTGAHSFYPPGKTPTYRLVPNPYFYGRKPRIRIELPGYASADDYRQYLANRLDTTSVPMPFLSRWKGKSSQYRAYASSFVQYITPNTHLPPFNNVHCRLAVAYAIDRETIVTRILYAQARATYAVVPRGMLGYYAGRNNPHYDRAKARAELAQCPGRTIPFELPYEMGNYSNGLSSIGGMLQSAGMNVRLRPLPKLAFLRLVGQSLDKTHTQIAVNSWVQDYPDPEDYCTILLHTGSPFDIGGWHSAPYDRLVDRADIEASRSKRARLYIQAQHIAISQGAFISLFGAVSPFLIKPYVHGLVVSEALHLWPRNSDWANVSISPH